ncbi:MAG: hypothetical protein V4808_06815 [Pseudomonadota bacterium]
MDDPVVRFTLLFGILGIIVLIGLVSIAWFLHRSYWKKLRQSGDPRAKERELMRQRKRR